MKAKTRLFWAFVALGVLQGGALPAPAETWLYFTNACSGCRVFDVDGQTPLAGSDYRAQLYVGAGSGELLARGVPVSFRTGAAAGIWQTGPNGGRIDLPEVAPGAQVFVQVRVWPSAFGETFEGAVANNAPVGGSAVYVTSSLCPASFRSPLPCGQIYIESFALIAPPTVTITVEQGYSIIGNPLAGADYTIAAILPEAPEGTLLYKFDAVRQIFSVNQLAFGRWSNAGEILQPGEGAIIFNPGPPFEVTFTGETPADSALPHLEGGLNLIILSAGGVQWPVPQVGDQIHRLMEGESYIIHSYEAFLGEGEWFPELPEFRPGEGVFYFRSSPPHAEAEPNQATVFFSNYVPAFGVDAPMVGFDCGGLDGAEFAVDFHYGATPENMQARGLSVPFGTGDAGGYFDGGVVTLPGIVPGGTVYAQVKVWEVATGETWELAATRGESQVIAITPGGGKSIPGSLAGLNGSMGFPCLVVNPSGQEHGPDGGDGSLSVTSNGLWIASVNDDWITVTSEDSGYGDGTIHYAVALNLSYLPRSGTITVLGPGDSEHVFVVTQAGQPQETFEEWAGRVGLPAGRRALLDRNGPLDMLNVFAFAFGLDPMTAQNGDLPSISMDGNEALFRYRASIRAAGISIETQYSNDLVQWHSIGVAGPGQVTVEEAEGIKFVSVHWPVEENLYTFFRVVVALLADEVPEPLQLDAPVIGPITSSTFPANYMYATVSGPGTVHFKVNGHEVTEEDPIEQFMVIDGIPQRVLYFENPGGFLLEFRIVARSFAPGMIPSEMVTKHWP